MNENIGKELRGLVKDILTRYANTPITLTKQDFGRIVATTTEALKDIKSIEIVLNKEND